LGQNEHGSKDFELFLNREDSSIESTTICNRKTFYLKKIWTRFEMERNIQGEDWQ